MSDRYMMVGAFQHRLLIVHDVKASAYERIVMLFNTGLRGAAFQAWASKVH